MCNVNIATGELLRYQVDLFLPGYIPIEIARMYKSASPALGILGTGWRVNLLVVLRQDGPDLILVDEDAVETRLMLAPGARHFASTDESVTIVRDGETLVLDRRDGKKYRFPSIPDESGLLRLGTIEDAHSNRISFHYGVDGLPKFVVDTVQRRLFFRFDSGRLTDIHLGTESTTFHDAMLQVRYTYDANGQLVGVEDAAGGVRRFEYEDGLLVREVDPVGRSLFWSYDDQRRCVRTWRDGGILYRKLDFDDTAMQVRVTDALGYTTVYGLDEKRNITSKTDPLGQSEELAYDANGNLLASSAGALTRLTLWDKDSKCLTDTFADGGQNKYYFDASDRLVRTELGIGEEWRQEYDERGDIIRVEGPGGEQWSAAYAPEGYVSRMTNSAGHAVYRRREMNGHVRVFADDIGLVYRAEYDILGTLIAVTDPLGNTTRRVVDQLGRVTEIHDPEGGVRRCRYDDAGRMIELVDETGQCTQYEYGAGDQPLHAIDAAGQSLSFDYDLEQQLTAVIDGRGHRVDISHDPLGRVSRIAESDGRAVTQSYVPGGDIVDRRDADSSVVRVEGPRHFPRSKTYPDGSQALYEWKDGLLRGATAPGGTISRDFDPQGRLICETQDDWAVHTSFDVRNNLIAVSEEDGRSVQYDYDQRRRVTCIRDSYFGEFHFTYDLRDLLIRLEYPNGFSKRLAYDRCDRMILTALHDPQGRILIERRFEYDRAARVTTETVARTDGGASYVKRFQYDEVGRLTAVLRDGAVEEWYRYDEADNIRACHLFEDSDIEGGNRVTRAGSTRFEYDLRGNRVARRDAVGATFYEHDADNRLRRVIAVDGAETTYRYDPVGRRVEKRREGLSTRFHWLVDTVFKESSEGGDSHYLFLPTTFFPIAMSRYGERYFVFFDQIASPRELISVDGGIVWSRDASAFGVDRVASRGDEPVCPIRFQGQYRDAETSLDYNYLRHYDSVLGRYLSPDPLGIDAGPNRYRYVPEPLTWIDPYGLIFIANLIPRCDWNKDQMKAFNDKVDRYNTEIQRRQEKGEEGITISPCARSSKSASEAYKKCNDVNGKKKEGSPDGAGKATDCKDDIDHIIDKQMGGEDNCDNYVPVNASVNRSLGSQMKREIAANPGKALTAVVAGTKAKCDDTTERTPACK